MKEFPEKEGKVWIGQAFDETACEKRGRRCSGKPRTVHIEPRDRVKAHVAKGGHFERRI